MHSRKPKFFIKELTAHNACFGEYFEITGSIFELPFEIDYIADEKHDFNTCENCLNCHSDIYAIIESYYKTFPLCCPQHAKLLTALWFDKNDFINLPKWVADKSLFTNHFIITHIKNDNWKEEITNYIDYAVTSFGSFPIGYGEPVALSKFLGFIFDLFNGATNEKPFPDYNFRKNFVLDYITAYREPRKYIKSDFNLLASTYDRWCKLFPFDLPIFAHLKAQYYHSLPFLSDTPKNNSYLGVSIGTFQTKERLIEQLIHVTTHILDSVDTSSMLDSEYIIDGKKYTLDLIKKNHQIDQSCLLNKFTIGEQDYIKTLKSWYKNEQSFLTVIKPILIDINSKPNFTMNNITASTQYPNYSSKNFDEIKTIIKDFLSSKFCSYYLYFNLDLHLQSLQSEILDNLFSLPSDKCINYLERIKFDLINIKNQHRLSDDFIDLYAYELHNYNISQLIAYRNQCESLDKDLDDTNYIQIGLYEQRISDNSKWLNVIDNFRVLVIHDFCSTVISFIDEKILFYNPNFVKPHIDPLPLPISPITITTSPKNEKFTALKKALSEYGFFSLPLVTALSDDSKRDKLIQLICDNDTPYQIAMFDYLKFLKFLLTDYSDNIKNNLYTILHKHILLTNFRTIKGNICVLNENSKDDRTRFTSFTYMNIVISDYNSIVDSL